VIVGGVKRSFVPAHCEGQCNRWRVCTWTEPRSIPLKPKGNGVCTILTLVFELEYAHQRMCCPAPANSWIPPSRYKSKITYSFFNDITTFRDSAEPRSMLGGKRAPRRITGVASPTRHLYCVPEPLAPFPESFFTVVELSRKRQKVVVAIF